MPKKKRILAAVVCAYFCIIFTVAVKETKEAKEEARFVWSAKQSSFTMSLYQIDTEPFYRVWKEYYAAIKEMQGEEYAFYIKDLQSDWEVGYQADHRIYSASAIKGPYVISIIEQDPSIIQKSKPWIEAAITVSDNDSYKALRRMYGHPVFQEWLNAAGAGTVQMEDNFAYVTAKEMTDMWAKTYDFFETDSESAKYCKGIFEHVMHSFLSETVGADHTVYSKAGWIAGTLYYAENDAGIVMDGEHPYVVAILSTACGRTDKLSRLASALHDLHGLALRDKEPEDIKKAGTKD